MGNEAMESELSEIIKKHIFFYMAKSIIKKF